MDNKIYSEDLTFDLTNIPERKEPRSILMCTPDHFDIVDVKNAFMEGQAGQSNQTEVFAQWVNLKSIYSQLTLNGVLEEVLEIKGAEGLEDMVFCANQTFPWVNSQGEKVVVMSKMKHPSRQKEVPFFEAFFKQLGYTPLHLEKAQLFEGMGDTIAHPFKRLLYGGFGHRSDVRAHEELSQLLQVPIVLLELPHPKFYHLDTCFLPIDSEHVMLCKEAFTPQGLKNISTLFKHLHFISEEEAEQTFCLNAHIPYHPTQKHAVIQEGSTTAINLLTQLGFTVHTTNTSEYMKSGGSVFCMKMMVY